MDIYKLAEWGHEAQIRAYGEHSAYVKCCAQAKRMRDNDIAEAKMMLNTAPEPSDSERSQWAGATKRYVEILEYLVDCIIDRADPTE